MKRLLLIMALAIPSVPADASPSSIQPAEPSATYIFDEKDGQKLMMDIYEPAPGSTTSIDGKSKPTVLYMFGGGFKEGERDGKTARRWFTQLTDEGYRVVSIDYRLGMKGLKKFGIKEIPVLRNAISLAVQDLYSATLFLIGNSDELGIDAGNIVLAGSSAGAISVLQGEWEICNRSENASVLPDGFNYAGVMAFSGAIFSGEGKIRFKSEPCPVMLCHGTGDGIVTYRKIQFFKLCFAGSDVISKALRDGGFNYNIYRFKDRRHEISVAQSYCLEEEIRFMETNVMKGEKRVIDVMVDDPSIPVFDWGNSGRALYK